MPNPALKESQKTDWEKQKEYQARLRKAQNGLKRTEEEIQKLEARDQVLSDEMQNPAISADVGQLMEIQREKDQIAERLGNLYEDWEKYSEELEELQCEEA